MAKLWSKLLADVGSDVWWRDVEVEEVTDPGAARAWRLSSYGEAPGQAIAPLEMSARDCGFAATVKVLKDQRPDCGRTILRFITSHDHDREILSISLDAHSGQCNIPESDGLPWAAVRNHMWSWHVELVCIVPRDVERQVTFSIMPPFKVAADGAPARGGDVTVRDLRFEKMTAGVAQQQRVRWWRGGAPLSSAIRGGGGM